MQDEFALGHLPYQQPDRASPDGHPSIYLTVASAYIFVRTLFFPISFGTDTVLEFIFRTDTLQGFDLGKRTRHANGELRESEPSGFSSLSKQITAGSRVGALRAERSVGVRPSTCTGVRRAFPSGSSLFVA